MAQPPMQPVPLSSTQIPVTGGVSGGALLGYNAASGVVNGIFGAIKDGMNFDLMTRMIQLQTDQMTNYYGLQSKLVGLNEHLSDNQVKIADKTLETQYDVAKLQKEQNVAIAKARANAAVEISKINALNGQFYGQPVVNQVSMS